MDQSKGPSKRRRVFAGLGVIWIGGIVIGLTAETSAPIAWKLAWVEYGTIGIVGMLGIWRGRDKDVRWERLMRRTQNAGGLVAAGLFLLGALPRWI